MNHTLKPKHLQILAELLARARGSELTSACAVTPEGEKIDLMRPARSVTGSRVEKEPPTAAGGTYAI